MGIYKRGLSGTTRHLFNTTEGAPTKVRGSSLTLSAMMSLTLPRNDQLLQVGLAFGPWSLSAPSSKSAPVTTWDNPQLIGGPWAPTTSINSTRRVMANAWSSPPTGPGTNNCEGVECPGCLSIIIHWENWRIFSLLTARLPNTYFGEGSWRSLAQFGAIRAAGVIRCRSHHTNWRQCDGDLRSGNN